MAATAGIAIENARLYEESARREQWLQASAEISGVLLSPGGDRDPLQLILNRIKELADADVATLVVPVDDPSRLRVAVATGDGEAELRGMEYPTQDTLVALAMDTGRGVRVGALERQQGYTVHLSQVVDVGPVMAVPLMGDAGPHGAIMLGRRSGRRNFTTADLDLAEVFANQAALVRELVEARAEPAAPGGARGSGPHCSGPSRPRHPAALRRWTECAEPGRADRRPRCEGTAGPADVGPR